MLWGLSRGPLGAPAVHQQCADVVYLAGKVDGVDRGSGDPIGGTPPPPRSIDSRVP